MKTLIPAILFVTAIGLYFTYIDEAYLDMRQLQAQETEFDNALEDVKKVEDARAKLIAKYQSIQSGDLDRLGTFLPARVDDGQFILDVNNVAEYYDVEIGTITKGEVEESTDDFADFIKVEEFRFSITSTYNDFISFISDLEKSLQLVDIVSIDVIANEDERFTEYIVNLAVYEFIK